MVTIIEFNNGDLGSVVRNAIISSLNNLNSGKQEISYPEISDNTIPIKSSGVIADSPLKLEGARLVSSVSIEAPGSTIYVSENLGISGSGQAFSVTDVSDGRRGYLIGYEADSSGSQAPFYRKFGAAEDITIQDKKGKLSPGASFTSTITATANRLLRKAYFESSQTVDNVTITLLFGDETGTIVFQENNISFVKDVEAEIDIPQGIFITDEQDYTIQVEGAILKGDTIDGSFVPFLKLSNQIWTRTELADDDNDRSIPSLHNFSTSLPPRVDLNTDLTRNIRISYEVTNRTRLSSLTLVVSDGDDKTLTLPASDGRQRETIALSNVDTSTEKTITFKLQGQDTSSPSNTIESNTVSLVVRDLPPQELFYYGFSAADNADIIDVATLNSIHAASGSFNINLGTTSSNGYIILLTPEDHDITSLVNTDSNFNVLSAYTKTEDIRSISSVNYNSFVFGPTNPNLDVNYQVTLS